MKKRQMNPYPLNILIDASEHAHTPFLSAEEIIAFFNTPTLLPMFEYLITAHMKPQMQTVIRYYYRDCMTGAQISERMKITRSRAGQIKQEAVQCLCDHPEWFDILKMGFSAYLEKCCKSSYEKAYAEGLEEGRKNGEYYAYQKGYDDCRKNHDSKFPRKIAELPDTPVEELGLTVRAHNCMKRSGINTLQEIAGLEPEELAAIKNLGVKSYNEIVDMLRTYGIDTGKYYEKE